MAANSRNNSSFPVILAVGSLILLILLLGYYFENCLKKQVTMGSEQQNVLGVSSFDSSASKNPVVNGETFNFVATVVGDQAGALNATVLFTLTGQGVINSNIKGPGACAKLTDTTAVCNNVDIDPNQTLVWTVPATAASNCSQSSPASVSLQTRLVATLVTSTSTATANCVANQPAATPTPNTTTAPGASTPTPSSQGGGNTQPAGGSTTGNQSGTSNTSNTGTNGTGAGGQNGSGSMSAFNIADFACSKVNGFPLVFLLFILWIILSAYYFMSHREE